MQHDTGEEADQLFRHLPASLDQLRAKITDLSIRDYRFDQPAVETLLQKIHSAYSQPWTHAHLHTLNQIIPPLFKVEELSNPPRILNQPFFIDILFQQLLRTHATTASNKSTAPHRGGAQREKPTFKVSVGVSGAPDLPAQVTSSSGELVELQEAEHLALRQLLHWLYRTQPTLRPELRAHLGRALIRLGKASSPPPCIRHLLELLQSIVSGFNSPNEAHASLLMHVVLPLHSPAGRLDSTTPAISLYHESLCHCTLLILRAHRNLLPSAVSYLLSIWPTPRDGNSSKEVLLLHELESWLELATSSNQDDVSKAIAPIIARSISSDNSRIAERALTILAEAAATGLDAAIETTFGGRGNVLVSALRHVMDVLCEVEPKPPAHMAHVAPDLARLTEPQTKVPLGALVLLVNALPVRAI